MTIKEVVPNLSNISLTLLIKRVIHGLTTNNSPYLNLTLQDATGEINARMWDVKTEDIEKLISGQVFVFSANSVTYNNQVQLKINSYDIINDAEIIKTLVISAPIVVAKEWEIIIATVKNFTDETLKKVILYLLETNYEDFIVRPAAVKMHHSVRNGLLWHTCTMLKMAKAIVEVYHDRQINSDLVYAGVIMHDFGKLEELTANLVTNFTLQGQLKGHIVLGNEAILNACKSLDLVLAENKLLVMLQHIILASHGKYEFGSPILPKILEAEIVHHLDNLDAKITIIDEALKNTKPNEFTNRLIKIENRSFLKHFDKN